MKKLSSVILCLASFLLIINCNNYFEEDLEQNNSAVKFLKEQISIAEDEYFFYRRKNFENKNIEYIEKEKEVIEYCSHKRNNMNCMIFVRRNYIAKHYQFAHPNDEVYYCPVFGCKYRKIAYNKHHENDRNSTFSLFSIFSLF